VLGDFPAQGKEEGIFPVGKNLDRGTLMDTGESENLRD